MASNVNVFRAACHRCTLTKLNTRNHMMSRKLSTSQAWCAGDRKRESEQGPIRFTGSKAASWTMSNAKLAPRMDRPWYQPLSISFSLAVFLVYFLWLREENDLDIELNYTLFERVPGMEEHQIRVALDYNRMYGKDTTELEKRLAELEAEKKQTSHQ